MDAEAPLPKLPRVEELDGLRGLLALWVALAHIFCWTGWATATPPRPFGRLWQCFVSAEAAVEVFIILSGFAIAFLLRGARPSWGAFMRGRFFRIYPTYAVCLAFGAATLWLTPFILQQAPWRDAIYLQWVAGISQHEREQPFAHALSHLTLLNGLLPRATLPDATATLLPPAWSISLEWQFYLFAPLVVTMTRSRFLWPVLGLVALLGVRFGGPWVNPNPAFLPAQLPLFLVGMGSQRFYSRWSATVPGRKPGWKFSAAVILTSAVLLAWRPLPMTLWTTVLCCALAGTNGPLARACGPGRRLLLHPWLQRLGAISYPLYLVHWPVLVLCLSALLRLKPASQPGGAVAWLLCFALPLMLLAAGLLHHGVEMPLMRFGKRRSP